MDPDGACGQCRTRKHECSLVPKNSETGKADHHHYTRSKLLAYRINMMQKSGTATATGEQSAAAAGGKQGAATAKGKQCAASGKGKEPAVLAKRSKHIRSSPEASQPEASDLAPSPSTLLSTSLAALGTLALGSGGSSGADAPADSPATTAAPLRISLCKHSTPASLAVPEGSHATQSLVGKPIYKLLVPTLTQHSVPFVVEVPAISKFLKPPRRGALDSPTDASQTSDSGSIAARIAVLERKMESCERKQESLEKWKHNVENRLKKLEP